jgi:DNA-binding transcriptional MerR regulator
MLTVSQVARQANIAPNTVRGYAKKFPDLFSEAATPLQGERRFNDDDVATICSLVALKNSGMALMDAAERLRSQEAPPVIDAIATPLQAPASPQTALAAPQATLQPYNDLQRQIDEIRHAQRRLEIERATERRNDKLQGALWGAIAALVAGGFVLWLLYLLP